MTPLHAMLPAVARWREEVTRTVSVSSAESANLADAIAGALARCDEGGGDSDAHALVGLFYELSRVTATVAFEAYPVAAGQEPSGELLELAARGMSFAARILAWAQRTVALQTIAASETLDDGPRDGADRGTE